MDKQSYAHTMEYYSTLKQKEVLSYTTTRMNFEDMMLNEISQAHQDCRIPLLWCISKRIKVTETESGDFPVV